MENKSKINYCLATWSGDRRLTSFDNSYLRRHIQHLNGIQHNLSQISIAHPENPDEAEGYTQYLRSLTNLDDGTPIIVHDVPNQGMSYGQWSRIFRHYGDQFAHYIFVEDDYVPVKDKFDLILVEMFNEKYKSYNCGYLCGLIFDPSGRYGKRNIRHAAISNGISSASVLQSVIDKYGELVDNPTSRRAQINFSTRFSNTGFQLEDYLDRYRAVFRYRQNRLWIYEWEKEDLFLPIQCLRRKKWNLTLWNESGNPTYRQQLFPN